MFEIESVFSKNRGIISDSTFEKFKTLHKSGFPISFIEEMLTEIGCPLLIKAHFAVITNCIFNENNGNLGGSIFIGKTSNLFDKQTFQMENVSFYNNTSGQGGCLYFSMDLENFDGSVKSCYFHFNRAGLGGVVAIIFQRENFILFKDCTFEENHAGVSGVSHIISRDGEADFIDCVFSKNLARALWTSFDFGAAGVLSVAGSTNIKVKFKKCILIGNMAETKGDWGR